MNYTETLAYLEFFANYEKTTAYRYGEVFSLERVLRLLDRLGDPHNAYPTVHVAGTKGKGSTCVFLASILQSAGFRTGLYTSPHLLELRERFQINGVLISEKEFADLVETIQPHAEPDLTYFEVTTACAFLWFARRKVEAAVVEVGLGGRLDATNVLQPEVAVLTPIGLDHRSILGSTLREIAGEKAGILKKGVPAVMASQPDEAAALFRRTADSLGISLREVDREIRAEGLRLSPEGSRMDLSSPTRVYRDLRVPLLGRHQVANASAAVLAAELFFQRRFGRPIPESAVRQGILQTEWPGRCQLFPGDPLILLDGAQTQESARALRATVEELFPERPVTLIAGFSTDKDLEGIAEVWGPWASRVLLTRADSARAEPVEKLLPLFEKFQPRLETAPSVKAALCRARETAGPEEILVVSGSLFVVAEAFAQLSRGRFLPPLPSEEQCGADHPGKQRDQRADQ